MRQSDNEQCAYIDGWVWLHDLENPSETKDVESASAEVGRLLGCNGGVTYKVVESAPVYSVPSRLQSEVSRLSPGSVTGFPATHHWIRLDSLDATEELNFISHWVFQHPSAPALRADWCKLNVLKKKSGILKVTWPGLKSLSSITPGFILYSLEWSFPPGRGGCGLVLAPETLANNFILCILVSIL